MLLAAVLVAWPLSYGRHYEWARRAWLRVGHGGEMLYWGERTVTVADGRLLLRAESNDGGSGDPVPAGTSLVWTWEAGVRPKVEPARWSYRDRGSRQSPAGWRWAALGLTAERHDEPGFWTRSLEVPCSWLALALAAGPAGSLVLRARRCRELARRQAGLCPRCGYDLRASPERCPECGATAARAA